MSCSKSSLAASAILLLAPGIAFAHGEEVFLYLGGAALTQVVVLFMLVHRWSKTPPVVLPIVGYIAAMLLAWYVGLGLPPSLNLFLFIAGMALLPLFVGVAVRVICRAAKPTCST